MTDALAFAGVARQAELVRAVYGTERTDHPGARSWLSDPRTTLVGGDIHLVPFEDRRPFAKRVRSPRDTRALVLKRGFEQTGGFWLNVNVWGERRATEVAQHVKKGARVHVTGRLAESKWTSKETGEERRAQFDAIVERGRSLGIILIGAEQTASEVERRIIANSAIRVVGRLDTAEAGRDEYGFLPAVHRQRATIVKPGTMILSQPELPIPLVTRFPFPSWATRRSEAVVPAAAKRDASGRDDPFEGLS